MSSDKTSRSQKFVGQSESPRTPIRAPDNNTFVGRSGSSWALKWAPDRKRFDGQLGSQWALIRVPDRKRFDGQSGSQWALIRAPDSKRFVGRLGSQWALIRASDHKSLLVDRGVYELWSFSFIANRYEIIIYKAVFIIFYKTKFILVSLATTVQPTAFIPRLITTKVKKTILTRGWVVWRYCENRSWTINIDTSKGTPTPLKISVQQSLVKPFV